MVWRGALRILMESFYERSKVCAYAGDLLVMAGGRSKAVLKVKGTRWTRMISN